MEYGVCLLSLIPTRAEPNDQSEMTTQLMFGDLVTIRGRRKNWVKIKNGIDDYDGWVSDKQIEILSKEEYNTLKSSEFVLLDEVLSPVRSLNDQSIRLLVMGSRLYNFKQGKSEFHLGPHKFTFEGHVRNPLKKLNRSQLIEDAMTFLNVPYLWGGKSMLGMDCSGFTQLIYAMNGLNIARDAWQQAEMGQPLSFIEEAEEGDLAFFDNEDGKIIHVGIMLKDNRIVHASGKIRIDRIDHQGIYKDEINDYSHSLRIIKKLI